MADLAMTSTTPSVTVGLPVYNGERFIEETLDALLDQTHSDFELIISDNASTDATPEICRRYAGRDARIRYLRADANRGASWNHTVVAELARSPYFKWAAVDDLCAPTFLERCLEVLERDDTAVLCHPGTCEIDERGRRLGRWTHRLRLASPDLHERWTDLLMIGYPCYHVYGVIRAGALRTTGLMGSFIESDKVLLAELSLHGRFAELEDELFLHRLHAGQSVAVHASRYDRGAWFDPSRGVRPAFPTWRFVLEYARALGRAPLSFEDRRGCLAQLGRWIWSRRRSFARDVKRAGSAYGGRLAQRTFAS